MKYLILMLLASVCGSAFAQNDMDFTKSENISLEYPNNVKVLVQTNPTVLLLEINKYNLDSLVKLATARLREITDEVEPENAITVTYTFPVSKEFVPQSIDYRVYTDVKTRFSFLDNGEIVQVKTRQDTLKINITYDGIPNNLLPPNGKNRAADISPDLDFYFIVNSLADLENFDFEALNNDLLSASRMAEDKISKKALVKNPKMPVYFYKEEGKKGIRWNNPVMENTIFSLGAGVGWVRDNMLTSINSSFVWDKGKYGFGFGFEDFYHFTQDSDSKFGVETSSFLTGIIRFNKLESKVKRGETYYNKYVNKASVLVGFLVENDANYFNKNTWKICFSQPIVNHLYIDVEVYSDIAFRSIYPAVKLRIN